MLRALCTALLLLAGSGLGAFAPERWFDKPLSPRVANYRIQAVLDWRSKRLEGRETLSWRNTGTAATQEIPLHLYMNAFKGPQSRLMREAGGRPSRGAEGQDWGYCQLKDVQLEGQALTGHFGEDETVWWVKLPRAVAPGESIRLELAWELQFPRLGRGEPERAGWGGYFLMASQWFPKAGVYAGDRWVCPAYHAATEFFSDFGTYDVELSVPNLLTLAHTGTAIPQPHPTRQGALVDAIPDPDPKRPLNFLWKLHAEDVHDFAWAAMPESSWALERREYRGVDVFLFHQPANRSNLERQWFATKVALRHMVDYGTPYPYPVLTVVDTPKDAAGADGMEYPTLVTASSRAFDPFLDRSAPEGITLHELSHQVFQGIVANNEVEDPWLDEGLATWFTHKSLERVFQASLATRRFSIGTDFTFFAGYWMDPSVDPLVRPGPACRDVASALGAAYAKAPLVLCQLEAMVGRPVMEEILRTYAKEYAFKHPTRQDFRRVAERVSGRDLGAFWRDFVEGTEVLDVVIHRVDNPEVLEGGWMSTPKGMVFAAPQGAAPGRRGAITLARRGGLRLPMTLWVRLENGQEQRLAWDGQDRWVTFDFDSPVTAALLDPDGNYPMLKDRLHASWTARPLRRGLHYWAQMAWGLLTGALQGMGLG